MSCNRNKHSYQDDNGSDRSCKRAKIQEMATGRFKIANRSQYDGRFPFFREPTEIGSFSADIERKYMNCRTQLKYYVKPSNVNNVHFDLKKGYHGMIRKDENAREFIDFILRWILDSLDKFSVKGPVPKPDSSTTTRQLHTDFVCWRGLLTKLLCTPYENREGWWIAVTRFGGTLYLCEFDTDDKKAANARRTERDDEMCCWGWKFEQYLTSESRNVPPDTEAPYNNCEAFCTVVRSRLKDHSIVFSGEVDAVCQTGDSKSKHYVEMKTSREISHPRQMVNFKRFKLIKWWAQSFLVGIPEIVCGFRDDDGIVHRLESYNTQKLPELSKDIPNGWRPNVCFNFLDHFLEFIKRQVTIDDPRVVHLFEWKPGQDITCTKLPADSDFGFLPDWYTSAMSNIPQPTGSTSNDT